VQGGFQAILLVFVAAVVDPGCGSGHVEVHIADIGKVFAPVLDFSTVFLIQFPGFSVKPSGVSLRVLIRIWA
jgi:SAM-dependent methyltransferase